MHILRFDVVRQILPAVVDGAAVVATVVLGALVGTAIKRKIVC